MAKRYSEVPANSQEATRDLQNRLARFALLAFVISGVMLAASLIADVVMGAKARGFSRSSRAVHITAQIIILLAWRVFRGKTLPRVALEIIDVGFTIGLCVAWALLGLSAPAREPIEFTIILATTYTVIARAVLVPSTFERTLWISAVSVLPTIVFFTVRGMSFIADATPGRVRTFLVFAALWCAVAVFTAATHSRQIYGLRRRIQEASKLGQYTLEEKIGEGGMGVVYRATHAMLRRPAAIKLLLPERASEQDLARFEREVQLTSRLSHPNTISIFDYGRTAQGVFYYVMEYLEGLDLQRFVELEGPIDPPRVVRILEQASGALAEAHALGLIHRDIKPANIILTSRADAPDIVKVVDFGLVKTLSNNGTSAEISVTHADNIVGTPTCLAPESITAPETVGVHADLYALGAVGYFLLTGQQVFEARTLVEMCGKHITEKPVPPSQRLGRPIAADLEGIVLACLAKSAADRPASAEKLRASLLACADAGCYDMEAARAFWRDQASQLRARAKPSPSGREGATMAIDLRGRADQET